VLPPKVLPPKILPIEIVLGLPPPLVLEETFEPLMVDEEEKLRPEGSLSNKVRVKN
jgi:hypothetical protein